MSLKMYSGIYMVQKEGALHYYYLEIWTIRPHKDFYCNFNPLQLGSCYDDVHSVISSWFNNYCPRDLSSPRKYHHTLLSTKDFFTIEIENFYKILMKCFLGSGSYYVTRRQLQDIHFAIDNVRLQMVKDTILCYPSWVCHKKGFTLLNIKKNPWNDEENTRNPIIVTWAIHIYFCGRTPAYTVL